MHREKPTTRDVYLYLELGCALDILRTIRFKSRRKPTSLFDFFKIEWQLTADRHVYKKDLFELGRAVGLIEGAALATRTPCAALVADVIERETHGQLEGWRQKLRQSVSC